MSSKVDRAWLNRKYLKAQQRIRAKTVESFKKHSKRVERKIPGNPPYLATQMLEGLLRKNYRENRTIDNLEKIYQQLDNDQERSIQFIQLHRYYSDIIRRHPKLDDRVVARAIIQNWDNLEKTKGL